MNNAKRRGSFTFSTRRKSNPMSMEQWRKIRKYRLLAKIVEESDRREIVRKKVPKDEDQDLGMNDLDFYLGAQKNKANSKASSSKPPKLRQIPFKIYKKKVRKQSYAKALCEKTGILKLFVYKKDSESSSESYTECESCGEVSAEDVDSIQDSLLLDAIDRLKNLSTSDVYNICELLEGAQIKEISEGTPCDNCPELCPGFVPHHWRSTCKACGCDRLKHAVFHEELCSVRHRLGLRDCYSGALPFDDSPPGLNPSQVERYWEALSEKAPSGASGSTTQQTWRIWKTRALAYQLPKQDLSLSHCRHVDETHKKAFEDFVSARNEIALDIGAAIEYSGRQPAHCMGCDKKIKRGDLAVLAPRLGDEAYFHPGCFTCYDCDELLVELSHCVMDGRIYCIRHYDDKMKPRCYACDELIFSGELTKAMNKDWHSTHFCCWQCDESLTGQRYVLRDDHPYCIKCYESVFANGCEECNKIIGIDSKDLSYKDKHWHEACFLCAKCRVSLVDKQFGSKLDKIYCGNCYDAQFASRCDGCKDVFRAGTKKMEYKTRQWHEGCFCCVVCKNPIGTKSFIPREQEIYCATCYEDKFATRCVKCNKIITQGGVTYKNEPWHRECFTCTNCDTSLAGQRFTSRDEKPYCAECFGELFAKRCTSCAKPITGIGGTRFISFEDRHWHNDCFICAQCNTSLVGKGFITDGQDIICPECAKQKLIDKTVLPLMANARDWCAFKTQDMNSDALFHYTDNINFRKGNP